MNTNTNSMGLSSAMLLKLALAACTLAAAVVAAGTPSKVDCNCGDVNISYPFGTKKGCFKDPSFLITCSKNSSGHYVPYLGTNHSIQVLDIFVEAGEMRVSTPSPYFCSNGSYVGERFYSSMPQKFAISNTKNNFTVLGCDMGGYLYDFTENRYLGCKTKCGNGISKNKKSCAGVNCNNCQSTFEKAITNYSVTIIMTTTNDNLTISGQQRNSCGYAFFAENGPPRFSFKELSNPSEIRASMVLNWAFGNRTCDEVNKTSSSACKDNSECHDYGESGIGYFCKCKPGFTGNPYLSPHDGGCEDVDECRSNNPCMYHKLCKNWAGGFKCSCPLGKKGKGFNNGTASDDWGCTDQDPLLLILLGITVALLVVFTLVSTLCWAQKQRTLKQLRQRNFEQNGGNLLLEQFSQRQGYVDRTKIFTEDMLKIATNNFDDNKILGRGGQGTVYKGVLSDNTPVAIKKSRVGGDPQNIKSFINEVFVLSQINHRNVVKLLGCCLETEVPLLVYEFVDNGTLLDHIDPLKNGCSIPWETRLRIAAETAEAISYLHSAASIPIIHRDIKSTNILLDHNGKAKVSDFGASRLVHIDETHVATVIQGTIGYLDPEYLQTGQLSEKSDVYSFGVVLAELLTGKKVVEFNRLAMHFVSSIREDRLWEILDKQVLDWKKNAKQLKEVALLARRCIRVNGEERPTMKEVAMELDGLIAMEKHSWGMDEDMFVEESEYLLGHIPDGYEGASTSTSTSTANHYSIQKQVAFEIANGR